MGMPLSDGRTPGKPIPGSFWNVGKGADCCRRFSFFAKPSPDWSDGGAGWRPRSSSEPRCACVLHPVRAVQPLALLPRPRATPRNRDDLPRRWLLPLLLSASGAIATQPAARAEPPLPPDTAEILALPGCRRALGVSAEASPAELLQSDPSLPRKLAAEPACRQIGQALSRLERLERELIASRERIAAQQNQLAAETARQQMLAADLALLRQQLTGSWSPPPLAAGTPTSSALAASVATTLHRQPISVSERPAGTSTTADTTTTANTTADTTTTPPVVYSPGKGFSMQAGGASLRLMAEAKLLGFSSSRYVFNPGQPLVVSPKNPDSSYDLSAQQSTVTAAFQGPRWGSWTPGAFALFTLQDNLLAEGYSFTPVVFYGTIGNGRWQISAGQNFDVFAPRDPDNLTSGKLASSGNPGSYRPQFRVEHPVGGGQGFGGQLQLAVSSPITTALPKAVDPANLQNQEVVEDNGWPNLEARLNLGFGTSAARAGGRQLRPVELGISGVVGQLRVLDNLRPTDPITLVADRSTVNVWGAALDGQIALGRRFGINGELYTGQGLGQYMAGIFQNYNRFSNQAVPTAGGWGQLYVYVADNLRFNLGYGIDHAQDSGPFGLQANGTAFANVIWDVNPWLQLGLEGNYKLTTYDSFGDKNAWVVISEVMFRL